MLLNKFGRTLPDNALPETIDTIFSAIAVDLNAYAEDRALWIARGKEGDKEPTPPDVNKIAEKQSLVAVESDWVTVNEV